jgi:hypothetical protein
MNESLLQQPESPQQAAPLQQNAESLRREINWFAEVVNNRLQAYNRTDKNSELPVSRPNDLKPESDSRDMINGQSEIAAPGLANDFSVYAEFVKYYQLNRYERLTLILALIPHIQPQLLDPLFTSNKQLGRGYTEFGGIRGSRHGGFIPTIETALFILAGNNLSKRFKMYRLFEPDHFFTAHNILTIESPPSFEPYYSSAITVSDEYVDFFTTGHFRKPQFSIEFPARRLQTQLDWTDLVLDDFTASQLEEIRVWLQHGSYLLSEWGMAKKLKPGYKVLFHGPPGTGKTLAASLLGKLFSLDVYRVDLSMVISKYIGETEKNLEKVFKKAENKNWILFFDEADALFGKRTSITDSHDKYANQEIAYLLQRLEEYPGLVILASNMRSNVDEAFTRRLQSVIHFPKPQPRERLRLWNQAFSSQCETPSREDMERISTQYDLTGGNIMNIVQFASLQALSRQENKVVINDILQGIKKELKKEGKTL